MASRCLRAPSVCLFPTANPAPSAPGSRPEAEAELARTQGLLHHLTSAGGSVTLPCFLEKRVVEGLLRKSNILRSLSTLEEAYLEAKLPRRIREAEALAPGHRAPEEQGKT